MVYNWRCHTCDFAVWAGSESAAVDGVQSHLLEHHRGGLRKESFQVGWQCPYCSEQQLRHDQEAAVEAYKRHLFDHVDDRLRSGVHVADHVGRTGNVLVLADPDSTGADNARVHFLAICDVAIVVTSDVADRLELLSSQRSTWPSRTIVLTTNEDPLADLEEMDFSDVPLEIVQLSRSMGLAEIGETVSRVVAEHDVPGRTLSVQFDVLSELIDVCELKDLFQFLHLLTARLESTDAVGHYYCNPATNSKPTINLLAELFDATVRAEGNQFFLED